MNYLLLEYAILLPKMLTNQHEEQKMLSGRAFLDRYLQAVTCWTTLQERDDRRSFPGRELLMELMHDTKSD